MNEKALKSEIKKGAYDERFKEIYITDDMITYQKNRYIRALSEYGRIFLSDDDVCICSAPGRTEIGGNHTDHQHGEVLAASISDDVIAVVSATDDGVVRLLSEGYEMIEVSASDTKKRDEEDGKTTALIRGILYRMEDLGYRIGGFRAYVTSDVLSGSGLSSSAAFETVIGTILSVLYNDASIDPIQIAVIGQYAENIYFGKPCGLMDQMACSVGGMCHMDFDTPDRPVVDKIDYDLQSAGYRLCITDTRGSHADLTDCYASIPEEMGHVANYFGKEYLRDVDEYAVIEHIDDIRGECGDRAFLRAMHFFEENRRVREQVRALKSGDIDVFLSLVQASGRSSYQFLQNVYPPSESRNQQTSVALMLSEMTLGGDGVCRIHGGGFAGTIQAFVREDALDKYVECMDRVFGKGASHVLYIRRYGGVRVV